MKNEELEYGLINQVRIAREDTHSVEREKLWLCLAASMNIDEPHHKMVQAGWATLLISLGNCINQMLTQDFST